MDKCYVSQRQWCVLSCSWYWQLKSSWRAARFCCVVKRHFYFCECMQVILRCQGRFQDTLNFSYLTKFPANLLGHHYPMTLYVLEAHTRVYHNGVKKTLTELRSCFWVIKGRSLVRRILHSCYVCQGIYEEATYCATPSLPTCLPTWTNSSIYQHWQWSCFVGPCSSIMPAVPSSRTV